MTRLPTEGGVSALCAIWDALATVYVVVGGSVWIAWTIGIIYTGIRNWVKDDYSGL